MSLQTGGGHHFGLRRRATFPESLAAFLYLMSERNKNMFDKSSISDVNQKKGIRENKGKQTCDSAHSPPLTCIAYTHLASEATEE